MVELFGRKSKAEGRRVLSFRSNDDPIRAIFNRATPSTLAHPSRVQRHRTFPEYPFAPFSFVPPLCAHALDFARVEKSLDTGSQLFSYFIPLLTIDWIFLITWIFNPTTTHGAGSRQERVERVAKVKAESLGNCKANEHGETVGMRSYRW